MGKSERWLTLIVRMDGFTFRQVDLTREVCHYPLKVSPNERKHKGGRMWWRMADESIVVMNS
jgi:hypothetical protein